MLNVAGRELSLTALTTVLTIITTVIGAWLFMDARFAHAEDLEEVKQEAQVQGWTMEQSQLDLRADIVEDRIWREEQKSEPNSTIVSRWKKQLLKLEKRAQWLQQLQDTIAAKLKIQPTNPPSE